MTGYWKAGVMADCAFRAILLGTFGRKGTLDLLKRSPLLSGPFYHLYLVHALVDILTQEILL